VQTGFAGRLQEIDWARPLFLVYRGRAEASGADLVAVITREACLDTMTDATERGGASDHTARVSLLGGEVRLGCCTAPRVPEALRPPAVPAPSGTATTVPGIAGGGEVTALTLPDGVVCRSVGKGATLAFEGRRASFTCGVKDGDTVALLGDLEAVSGGFRIVRARIAQGERGFKLVSSEPILVTSPR